MGDVTGLFVNGVWQQPTGEQELHSVNPADTREEIGRFRMASPADAVRAVDAAAAALEEWRAYPAPVRARIVGRAARLVEEQQDELAALLTREEGKRKNEAMGEITRGLRVMEFYAGEGWRLTGETIPSELPRNFTYSIRQPVGVVAIITPWNFPFAIPVWKLAPALTAGNTVVMKPASLTPVMACRIVEIFRAAGLPDGVLNLVVGPGGQVGNTIIDHPAVRAVSFTGSTETGQKLYERAARQLMKVSLELGGKNPVVICRDADLALAVAGTVDGAFGSTGQRCTATSRVIVEHGVADEVRERLVDAVAGWRLGSGLDPDIQMGPLVDEAQLINNLRYLEIGRNEGGRILTGGSRAVEDELQHGYFVQPTVFDQVDRSMTLAREEVFGPVLSIIEVADAAEALQVANQVDYGLTASIYTRDLERAMDFIDRSEVGMVHVNSPTVGGEPQLPFGGVKHSGVGEREMGREGIRFFTELKTVFVDYSGGKTDRSFY
ncbi:MAG: aldehyde dehydrogenase family protein [Thermaerobacterales bacterium]